MVLHFYLLYILSYTKFCFILEPDVDRKEIKRHEWWKIFICVKLVKSKWIFVVIIFLKKVINQEIIYNFLKWYYEYQILQIAIYWRPVEF